MAGRSQEDPSKECREWDPLLLPLHWHPDQRGEFPWGYQQLAKRGRGAKCLPAWWEARDTGCNEENWQVILSVV